MRFKDRHFSRRQDELDPVALCLAIWLGLIACAAGVARLSEATTLRSALTELYDPGARTAAERPVPSPAAWLLAYGS